MSVTHDFSYAFMAFFAIMNPLAGVPVFLSLTEEHDSETTRLMALKSLSIAFAVVLVFSLAGKAIFELFDITLPALRIAGGTLIFLIGLAMLQGTPSSVQYPSRGDQQSARQAALSVAVSPLAVPLLAGPGTIATAMNLSASQSPRGLLITLLAFGILCVLTYYCFIWGRQLMRWVGTNAFNVMTRMMGLILSVIGVQMLITGLKDAFPALAA